MLLLFIFLATATSVLTATPEKLQSLAISLAPLAETYKTLPEESTDLATQLLKKAEQKKKKDLEAEREAEEQQKLEEEDAAKQKEAEDKLRQLPLEEIYRQIKLYSGATSRLKFLDPVLSADQIKIMQTAQDKAKKEITESLAAVDKQLAKQIKTAVENDIDSNVTKFEIFRSQISIPDVLYTNAGTELAKLQKELANPTQDNKIFFKNIIDIKLKLAQLLDKISNLPKQLAKPHILDLGGKIVAILEKSFTKPSDAIDYLASKKEKVALSGPERSKLVNELILPKFEDLLQKYALSNNPTAKNYSVKNDQANFANLQEFIEAATQIPEAAPLITKLKNSPFITRLKDIRDSDIRKLEELYAYFGLEQNQLKLKPGSQILLERIAQEIEKLKTSIAQKFKDLTLDIPALGNTVRIIKQRILHNYPSLELKKEEELKAEKEQAKNILNYLILFYLNPEGTINQRLAFLMNTTSRNKAADLFAKNLEILEIYGDEILKSQYEEWYKKLKDLSQAGHTAKILHTDLSEFKDPEELIPTKKINKLLIENYDIKNKKFKRNIKKELDALKSEMTKYKNILGYDSWIKKHDDDQLGK